MVVLATIDEVFSRTQDDPVKLVTGRPAHWCPRRRGAIRRGTNSEQVAPIPPDSSRSGLTKAWLAWPVRMELELTVGWKKPPEGQVDRWPWTVTSMVAALFDGVKIGFHGRRRWRMVQRPVETAWTVTVAEA